MNWPVDGAKTRLQPFQVRVIMNRSREYGRKLRERRSHTSVNPIRRESSVRSIANKLGSHQNGELLNLPLETD